MDVDRSKNAWRVFRNNELIEVSLYKIDVELSFPKDEIRQVSVRYY